MNTTPRLIAKDWLTVAELARLGLRGLPITKFGVQKLADRDGWCDCKNPHARRRNGRGGGWEFHIDNLPLPSRHHLAELRYGHALPSALPVASIQPQPEGFTTTQACRRDARLEILSLFETFHRTTELAQRTAEIEFSRLYNAGSVAAPDWVRTEISKVSSPTIQRWRKQRRNGRAQELGGKYHRGKKSVLARANGGDVALYIGALIVKQPHLTAAHIRDICRDKFDDELVVDSKLVCVPPLRTFQRFVTSWTAENKIALLKLTNPDGFKNSARIAGQNMNAHVARLNQLWEIDASPADVLTKDGRRNIYAVVDIYSRRMLVSVSDTARTQAMLLLLRKAITVWGVPETLRSDNGSDFISYEAKRAINSLGIEHDITAPFSPEKKGTVERAIGTLQRGLMPLLPGFIGHNVADRKVIEGRRAFAQRLGESDNNMFCVDLSSDELQAAIDNWVSAKYEQSPHAGLAGEKPALRAAGYTGSVNRIENERALDLLLAPIAGKNGVRTVTKHGIRLDGAAYLTAEILPGEQVFIRHDPADMGRIYCFSGDDGVFLGAAICPDRAGIDPKEAVAATRAAQARRLKDEVAPLKAEIKRMKPRDMLEAVLRTANRDAGTVAPFPRPSTVHETPALVAALDAGRGPEPTPLTGRSAQIHAEIKDAPPAPMDRTNVTPIRSQETRQQRFRRALELQQSIDADEAVDPSQAQWLGGYQAGPEFKAMSKIYEEYGDQALV